MIIPLCGLSLAGLLTLFGPAPAENVRKAVWAGSFYESDPVRLAAQVDAYLENAPAGPGADIQALVVPHAGYVYSGRVAACAYRLVKGRDLETVVIIGPSHRHGFQGCSIWPDGGFASPLGVVPIDAPLAAEIARTSGFGFIPEAHKEEHSLEVQVPFIQRVLPEAKIVPIVMGYPTRRTVQALVDGLAKSLPGKNVLLIASTDMSHFLSRNEARAVDEGTIGLIRESKASALLEAVEGGENILCGGGPVAAVLLYAGTLRRSKVDILRYGDSAEAGGPEDRVVGYLAAAVRSGESRGEESAPLSSGEKKELLRLARAALVCYLDQKALPEKAPESPRLKEGKGVFVTLRKHGDLRGCIGFIEPAAPLYQAVIQAAIYAASQDPRFDPVSRRELDALELEISVLSPLRQVTGPGEVQVGRHGLVIAQGGRRGLLLPQVPLENGWDRETFLAQGCLKAGLPPDAWRRGAQVFIFEAVVFREGEER